MLYNFVSAAHINYSTFEVVPQMALVWWPKVVHTDYAWFADSLRSEFHTMHSPTIHPLSYKIAVAREIRRMQWLKPPKCISIRGCCLPVEAMQKTKILSRADCSFEVFGRESQLKTQICANVQSRNEMKRSRRRNGCCQLLCLSTLISILWRSTKHHQLCIVFIAPIEDFFERSLSFGSPRTLYWGIFKILKTEEVIKFLKFEHRHRTSIYGKTSL